LESCLKFLFFMNHKQKRFIISALVVLVCDLIGIYKERFSLSYHLIWLKKFFENYFHRILFELEFEKIWILTI
jgi:hypothetical protein